MYRYQNCILIRVVVYYGCQFYSALQLIILKNPLIHTLLYHTIYCSIIIQKQQHIDTRRLCIFTPLTSLTT